MSKPGSLVCVGVGMTLGSHLTPLCRSYIEQADVVFTGLSDGVMELWIAKMHPDVRSLQQYYREGKPRTQTYREMVEAMLTEVRAGRKVCGAFYGHPAVFARPPRMAVAAARSEGYPAHIEPGVSAEDCLYADLEIDPGDFGCQHYEASQVMFCRRRLDPTAYLILWQIGIAGDQSFARFSTGAAYRRLLVEILSADYDLDHEVILYKAATLPTNKPAIERLKLRDLPAAKPDIHMTLVVPPGRSLEPAPEIRRKLTALDHPSHAASASARTADQFSTARLHLRRLSAADQQLFCELYTAPETMRFIALPQSPQQALRNFGKALRLTHERKLQLRFYTILHRETGEAIGICGVQRPRSRRYLEAGIMLSKRAVGQGFGSEAFAALLKHTFRTCRVHRLFASVHAENLAAQGLVRTLGFTRQRAGARESSHWWSVSRASMSENDCISPAAPQECAVQ